MGAGPTMGGFRVCAVELGCPKGRGHVQSCAGAELKATGDSRRARDSSRALNEALLQAGGLCIGGPPGVSAAPELCPQDAHPDRGPLFPH